MTAHVAATSVLLLVASAGSLIADDNPAFQRQMKYSEGTWLVVSQVVDGTEMPAPALKTIRLVMKGDTYQVLSGKTVVSAGTYKIVEMKGRVIKFDYTLNFGPLKGQTVAAIYTYNNPDTFQFCAAAPGKDRPTDFSAKVGSGQTLTVYRREGASDE